MIIDNNTLDNKTIGVGRVLDIISNQLENGITPKTITYKDIDTEMMEFISKEVPMLYVGKEIPTFFFTQQRFNEFTKTWEMLDENNNLLPNFKTVTRENNPKPGTLMGNMFNIPGKQFFNVSSFEKKVGNKNITVTCKMKQPYCVDLMYNVKFITNKLSLLNELNNIINEKFKSKYNYISVNGYYMPIYLEDIDDESEYDIDERKIFIQNFRIKVCGYIINKNDIIYVENPNRILVDISSNKYNPKIITPSLNENQLIIEFPIKGNNLASFRSKSIYHFTNIETENIIDYKIYINNILAIDDFKINKYDRVTIKIIKESRSILSKIILK